MPLSEWAYLFATGALDNCYGLGRKVETTVEKEMNMETANVVTEKKLEWEIVNTFATDECGDVVVIVSRLPLREPKWSLRLGTKIPADENKVRPYVQYANSHNPDGVPPGAVCELVARAEAFIAQSIAELLESSEKQDEERRIKAKEKKSKYLANVEARREANREQTNKAKGKR